MDTVTTHNFYNTMQTAAVDKLQAFLLYSEPGFTHVITAKSTLTRPVHNNMRPTYFFVVETNGIEDARVFEVCLTHKAGKGFATTSFTASIKEL